jgi:hypothetical protein
MKIQGNALIVEGSNDPFVRAAVLLLNKGSIESVIVNEVREDKPSDSVFVDIVINLNLFGLKATVPAVFNSGYFWHWIGHGYGAGKPLPFDEYDDLLDALRELIE